ncbi:hypothetical protein Ahy_A09g043928 [Arachis hypogaea]|uniref:Uncharacterized protein n=1 Tax=Arachis hypogaea TaxID=3818 RepID=A0A445BJ87_ARAHY|nr:hypothetical protein Ahy_A09g043928 [Arachis hypogaea]
MFRYDLFDETQNKLDYILSLTVENLLGRRLHTLVFKSGIAKSIHQRYIRSFTSFNIFPQFRIFKFLIFYHSYAPRAPRQWWFGKGTDLTPSYIFEDDVKHFHSVKLKELEAGLLENKANN